MSSELESIRERIKLMKMIKQIEQKKLDEIPLKDRQKELKQRLSVRDIEKKIRELEEQEFKLLHNWWGKN